MPTAEKFLEDLALPHQTRLAVWPRHPASPSFLPVANLEGIRARPRSAAQADASRVRRVTRRDPWEFGWGSGPSMPRQLGATRGMGRRIHPPGIRQ